MFDENVPAAGDKAEMDAIIAEGARMGLDPADLNGEIAGDLEARPADPFAPDLGKQDDTPATPPAVTPAPQPEKKPEEEGEPLEEEEDPENPESEEGEDGGQPPADSGKFITKGEFGKLSRDLKNGLKSLADAIKAQGAAKTLEAAAAAAEVVAEQADEITAYAKKLNLDPAALKEFADIVTKQALGKVPLDKLQGLEKITPVVAQMSESMQREQIIADFNREWEEAAPTIQQQFPNATPEQLKKAKLEMRTLATSEKYGYVEGKHEAYPLSHILAIEATKFKDILFSPKKRTAETGRLGGADEPENSGDVVSTQYEEMTPARAKQMEEQLLHQPGEE